MMYSIRSWLNYLQAQMLKLIGSATPTNPPKSQHDQQYDHTEPGDDDQKSSDDSKINTETRQNQGSPLTKAKTVDGEQHRPIANPNSFCQICYTLRPTSHTPFEAGQDMQLHLHRFDEFTASSKAGCATCSFVVDTVSRLGKKPEDDWFVFVNLYENGACDLTVADTAQKVQIYTPVEHTPAWKGIVHARELSPDANSPEALQFIQSCLSKCNASHPDCQRTSSELPTRLIDVGHTDSSHVRLVETAAMLNEQYVALSYCWGQGQKIVTTRDNYADMQTAVSVADLPQTLQDTILLTRQLGQNYIWIDALCIIQDCNDDWEHEATTMATVYRNAYLTIAANTAAAASEGFLAYEHPITEYSTILETPWRTDEGVDTILASRVIPSNTKHLDGHDEPLPLETRGWGLQERVLSTRVLSYTAHELHWICQTGKECECGKLSQTTTYGDPPNQLRKKMRGSVFKLTAAEAWDKWNLVVDGYSGRLLTNQKDKLPAIAGVARVIQDLTGSTYIAGLWQNDLVLGLAWDTGHGGYEDLDTIPRALETYVAPTFSWASLSDGVIYSSGSKYRMEPYQWHPECQVLDSGTELRGKDPLGQVNGGFVRLRGSMAKIELRTHTTEWDVKNEIWHVQFRNEQLPFHSDSRLEEFQWSGEDGQTERSVRRSPFGSEEKMIQPGATVYMFSLGYWMDVYRGKERWEHIFLLLGRSAGKAGVFERVGFCIAETLDGGGSRVERCEEFQEVQITLV